MNVNLSSSTSSANSLWSLIANRAAAAGKNSSTTTSYESSDTASTSSRPEGPPPPPSQFDCAMSTAQFAGQATMGPPPGEDPIASLDADDDGSVSADEFGLDDASAGCRTCSLRSMKMAAARCRPTKSTAFASR